MKKIHLAGLALVFALSSQQLAAQTTTIDSLKSINTTTNPSNPKKVNFGLGFGMSFVGGTNISLAPNLSRRLSDKLSIGGGLQFNYAGIKNLQKTITYGLNAFGYFTPVKRLLTTLEFSEMRVNQKLLVSSTKKDFWESALFIGAGLEITPKISAGAKYNVLYKKDKSIYTSPVIPFVNIGF